jgi:hypothetical protein
VSLLAANTGHGAEGLLVFGVDTSGSRVVTITVTG